jgi:hypothetical protein
MSTIAEQSRDDFYGVWYARGLRDGWVGEVFDPPLYNKDDRAAYRKGFDDAREDKLTQKKR